MNKFLSLIRGLYISRQFRDKLYHNFHELTTLEKIVYYVFIRLFFSREKRFFFEGNPSLIGQMYVADRKALFDVVINKKPRQCFEIGTYTGGGSTYFLASAFYKLGKGKVITLENDAYYYRKAKNFYGKHLPHLIPFVEFVYGDNPEFFKKYIDKDQSVDMVFLDGAEDSSQTNEQFKWFSPYFSDHAIVAMHDWNTEKMAAIKPEILADVSWKKIIELQPPQSIGFAIFEKI